MKSILISIHPKWCELIANGKKTIEVRKTKPNIETPFKCYIYCTSVKSSSLGEYVEVHQKTCGKIDDWNGKVIGEFVCDEIDTYDDDTIHSFSNEDYCRWNDFDLNRSCIHPEDFENYANDKWLYGWNISDLKIYDKPKELGEFKKAGFMSEEVWLAALYPNTHCHYEAWAKRFEIARPPQSWCYVEEI